MQGVGRMVVPALVFAVALLGAIGVWMLHERSGDQPTAASGNWEAVLPAGVDGLMRRNAAMWRQQHEMQTAVTRSRKAVLDWLASLATGDALTGRPAAELSAATIAASRYPTSPGGRLADMQAWAHALPSQRLVYAITSVRVLGSDATTAPVRVNVRAALRVRQARRGFQRLAIPMQVETRPSGAGRDIDRGQWSVVDVRAGDRGVRSLDAPRLLVRPHVDVLAGSADAGMAATVADEGERSVVRMHDRYAALNGPLNLLIMAAHDRASAEAVLGPARLGSAGDPTGWTYPDGDVVVLAGLLAAEPEHEAVGTTRHEVVHVVTLDVSSKVPTLFAEGVATWEESTLVAASTGMQVDLTRLQRAFRNGTIDYQQLLRSKRPFGAGGGTGKAAKERVELGYLAGYATIGYLEDEAAHDKLVGLLKSIAAGAPIEQSMQRTYGLTTRQLEARVRTWTTRKVNEISGRVPASNAPSTPT